MIGSRLTCRTETPLSSISSASSSSAVAAKASRHTHKHTRTQNTHTQVCVIPSCLFPGVVTAEMCQSKEDSEVMSKMVEELDEVSRVASSCLSLSCQF